uniref:Otopetrin 2 n=1 Tax=Molossus molossus TaxID=27622 RepID=A0A7J8D0M2_MOLMO|nr:otopetrin 2 [Molossus molossus]
MSEELAPGPQESPPAPRAGPREVWKKGGRLLSVLLAVNVLLLACTLISGGAFNKVAVYDTDVFALLTTMMLLSALWILFYLLRTVRCPDAVPYRDAHAGPIWLRGGLVLFGICSLVMDIFKTGYYSSFFECQSAIKILHPLTQAVFVIIQTYFLWVSAKDCIHVHLDLTRCGLMFTLTTNLAIWMAAVVDESVHQAYSHSNASHSRLAPDPGRMGSQIGGDCSCNTAICQIFQQGYFYLYPFNIEYSLFASTMLYVMWKNVGRLLASSAHGHSHAPARNVFIIESLHRGPPGAEPHGTPPKEPCLTFANLDALHTLPTCPPSPRLDGPSLAGPQETIAIILAPKGHWRRRCLKDISLFLLLCNIILWIMPAFGARPHFSNKVEVDFYGYSLWAAIVNICLPFGIFYRMHAVSSLLEVYVLS